MRGWNPDRSPKAWRVLPALFAVAQQSAGRDSDRPRALEGPRRVLTNACLPTPPRDGHHTTQIHLFRFGCIRLPTQRTPGPNVFSAPMRSMHTPYPNVFSAPMLSK
jgi:hypothetical protein